MQPRQKKRQHVIYAKLGFVKLILTEGVSKNKFGYTNRAFKSWIFAVSQLVGVQIDTAHSTRDITNNFTSDTSGPNR
jgi:hypothetical protein